MNVTKRIDDLEKKLDLTGVESPLKRIQRRQSCIIRFHSLPTPSQPEMVAHAKHISKTKETLRDSLELFMQLVSETGKPREIKQTVWGFAA